MLKVNSRFIYRVKILDGRTSNVHVKHLKPVTDQAKAQAKWPKSKNESPSSFLVGGGV